MVTWVHALAKTRARLARSLSRVVGRGGELDEESLEDLEETLLGADVPVRMATEWIERLDRAYHGLKTSRRDSLRQILVSYLEDTSSWQWPESPRPYTVLLVGVNGSGKTTTCAKLAHGVQQSGLKPLMAAADTFRAAGADQLRLWGEQVGCDVVGGQMGSDAASVAYDALEAARARASDVLLIDTAGRMHTKKPLMEELNKMRRALEKQVPDAPQETWVVLDASLGQNALIQARYFHEVTPLTGAVVTKLDGSSKAGFLFAVTRELGIPIRFAGLGEGEDDLVPFDAEAFVDALLGNGEGAAP